MANFTGAGICGAGGFGIDNGEDNSRLRVEIIISTYTG